MLSRCARKAICVERYADKMLVPWATEPVLHENATARPRRALFREKLESWKRTAAVGTSARRHRVVLTPRVKAVTSASRFGAS